MPRLVLTNPGRNIEAFEIHSDFRLQLTGVAHPDVVRVTRKKLPLAPHRGGVERASWVMSLFVDPSLGRHFVRSIPGEGDRRSNPRGFDLHWISGKPENFGYWQEI